MSLEWKQRDGDPATIEARDGMSDFLFVVQSTAEGIDWFIEGAPREGRFSGRVDSIEDGKEEAEKALFNILMSSMDKKSDRHSSKFNVRLPEIYRRQLRKLSDKSSLTMADEVMNALEEYLAKHELWPPEPGVKILRKVRYRRKPVR